MVTQQVIRGTHPQTPHGAGKETAQRQHVRRARRPVPRRDQSAQVQPQGEESGGADEVRVHVDRLVVQVEQRAQAAEERAARAAVAVQDGGVVAPPGGEVVPGDEAGEGVFELGFEGLRGGEEGGGQGGAALPEGGVSVPVPVPGRRGRGRVRGGSGGGFARHGFVGRSPKAAGWRGASPDKVCGLVTPRMSDLVNVRVPEFGCGVGIGSGGLIFAAASSASTPAAFCRLLHHQHDPILLLNNVKTHVVPRNSGFCWDLG